MKKEGIE